MWYVFAVLSTVLWGFSDVLFERFYDKNDKLHTIKYLPFTGFFGLITALFLIPFSESKTGILNLLIMHKSFALIPFCYLAALVIEEKSLKNVPQSVISPVSNTSCLLIFYTLVIIYKMNGRTQEISVIHSPLNITGTVLILTGLLILSFSDIKTIKGKKMGIALIIPLLVAAIFDAGETISEALLIDGIISDSENIVEIGCIDFLILYGLYSAIICFFAYIYICIKEHHTYNPFDGYSKKRLLTAFIEFEPNVLYCLALEEVPILTAFISSCYSIFTVVFCAMINKTGLKKNTGVPVFMIITGILFFGIAEAFSK